MSWYNTPAPQSEDSLGEEQKDFITKLVGVTFDNRQENIKKIRAGETILLIREPNNPYDENAIAVSTRSGLSLGHIKRELAYELAPRLDRLGRPLEGKVLAVTGGDGGRSFGVNISFNIP